MHSSCSLFTETPTPTNSWGLTVSSTQISLTAVKTPHLFALGVLRWPNLLHKQFWTPGAPHAFLCMHEGQSPCHLGEAHGLQRTFWKRLSGHPQGWEEVQAVKGVGYGRRQNPSCLRGQSLSFKPRPLSLRKVQGLTDKSSQPHVW